MPESQRIGPVLVEKALQRYHNPAHQPDQPEGSFESMEAAIQEVLDELGLKEERDGCSRCLGRGDLFNGGWKRTPCPNCKGTGLGPMFRYASDRRPVEQGDAK